MYSRHHAERGVLEAKSQPGHDPVGELDHGSMLALTPEHRVVYDPRRSESGVVQSQRSNAMSLKRSRHILAASTARVAALALGACGNGDGGGDGATADAGGGDNGGDLVTVGFVAVGPEGAWRQANEQNIQDTFTEEAGYELKFAPAANLDQASQIAAFTSFVDEGVDVILLSATEGSGWEDSLRRAQEAEIPVILIDRGIEPDDTDLYVSRIAPDNMEVSSAVAEWAVSEFPDGGRYFVLEGPAGVSVVNERNEGWDAVMDSHPEFEKVGAQTANWSTEEAR